MAVTGVDDKTILTVREMEEKYPTKWIGFKRVSEPHFTDPGNDEGYIIFLGDTDYGALKTVPKYILQTMP